MQPTVLELIIFFGNAELHLAGSGFTSISRPIPPMCGASDVCWEAAHRHHGQGLIDADESQFYDFPVSIAVLKSR